MQLTSSNPLLANNDAFGQYYGGGVQARADVATIPGVINKTAILVAIALIAGGVGYWALQNMPGLLWISMIASLLICLGFGFMVRGNPKRAKVIAPIYAVVEGIFLGGLTGIADSMLAARGISVVGGVGAQAFVVTGAAMASVLLLYRAGIVKPTKRFMSVISVATGAIMLAYLVSFVLSIFWKPLPLISFASAVNDQGMMGFLGLGINVLILIIASLYLVIDFKLVEDNVKSAAPKYMEWYCGFALLVTLAWIYYEAVKLVLRLAVLFGNRD